ncbi:MAG: hypothetical protein M1822_007707 [Bathelium mastoideum]|nr:MAG: hypothetical protein M1822_007707 [Bathelium mastoideum]
MASITTDPERAPLLASPPPARPSRPQRNVTFNPTVSTSGPASGKSSFRQSIQPQTSAPITSAPPTSQSSSSQSLVSNINNKLRRRHSQGAPLIPPHLQAPKIGPQRTTRNAQKLKLLPDPEHGEDGPDEESGRDVYSQFTRIKDPTARRDAARLGKADRARLPRVTAFCTASVLQLDDLMRYLKSRPKSRGAAPKRFDECIYTPYRYSKTGDSKTGDSKPVDPSLEPHPLIQRRHSDSALEVDNASAPRDQLIDIDGPPKTSDTPPPINRHSSTPAGTDHELTHRDGSQQEPLDIDMEVHTPEVFLFNYGVVVTWGMTVQQEQRFLKEIAKFENEKLSKDDVQVENFNFYYTKEYQARIYNDFITLRSKTDFMLKLAISHALAQSVKTSLFEDLVDATIENTKDIPLQISETGKVNLNRKEINMQIGDLFILRINIHLQGSVLDAPELLWAEPHLEPVYNAVATYLEIAPRVRLLNERLTVIGDLLAVLKEQLSHAHGENLEWIVIILIAAEILVAAINIVVDIRAEI